MKTLIFILVVALLSSCNGPDNCDPSATYYMYSDSTFSQTDNINKTKLYTVEVCADGTIAVH